MWQEQKNCALCHLCSHHILKSSVIYYSTDQWQHGIYLFYMIKKENIVNVIPTSVLR